MGKRRISTSFLIVFLVVILAACTSNGSGSSGFEQQPNLDQHGIEQHCLK